ncbi:hypothetical protein [Inquilinus sp.]|jgi:hypothetical protein|uniref:hypothetical protein n=1 Tax=Inquilinus sp. TaxID=1932117 RepID=UPI00378340B8
MTEPPSTVTRPRRKARAALLWLAERPGFLLGAVMLVLAFTLGEPANLKDGFYARPEALCRTGPAAIDPSLIKSWSARPAKIQKVEYDSRHPDRLIVDASETCRISRGRNAQIHCPGDEDDEAWDAGYVAKSGSIYINRREFRYCGPIPG